MTDTKRVWGKVIQDPIVMGIYEVEFDVEVVPHSTALLIVDIQKRLCCRDIGMGPTLLKQAPERAEYWFSRLSEVVVPNVQRLLKFFRSNKLRVIYACGPTLLPDASDMAPIRRIREQSRLRTAGINHFFYPGTLGNEVVDELKPQEGEMIFNKNTSSVFNSTNIHQILRNMRVDSLVITGVATNACVEAAARDAQDLGYNCILIDDACAGLDQDAHAMTMIAFASSWGKVMTTQEVIECLEPRLYAPLPQEAQG